MFENFSNWIWKKKIDEQTTASPISSAGADFIRFGETTSNPEYTYEYNYTPETTNQVQKKSLKFYNAPMNYTYILGSQTGAVGGLTSNPNLTDWQGQTATPSISTGLNTKQGQTNLSGMTTMIIIIVIAVVVLLYFKPSLLTKVIKHKKK